MSGRGRHMREATVRLVYRLSKDPAVLIVPQSRQNFDMGLVVYDARHDKGYTLVDCISMNTMRRMDLFEILTHDHHFTQEGFEVLIS